MFAQKLVVIGLDGADWRVLQPEIDAGRLPVLAKLQREGSYGHLNSTIRPESSVAWSTFATGVNPGKHGVFGFLHHVPGTYDFSLANSQYVAVRRFWDYLGKAGHRVGLLNIPFTYPPQAVHGFLIGGMLTPGTHVPFTHPPELQEKLLSRFRPFLFDAGGGEQENAAVASRVFVYTQQQLRLAQWLLQEEVWDCFVMVFTGLDRLQHFAWGESEHKTHLEQLDAALGDILATLPAETIVVIMSDHGFSGVANRFYVNKWLQAEGYLTLRPAKRLNFSADKWFAWVKRLPFAATLKRYFLPAALGPTQLKTAVFSQSIDWLKTKVYYAPDGGLRINLQGRESKGIVTQEEYEGLRQELITKLHKLRDPRNDQHPVAEIYTSEQLYTGPFAHQAPDLIVEPQRDNMSPEQNYILDGSLAAETAVFCTAEPYNGNHASKGVFLAWAPDVILQQKIKDIELQDVAPTILATFNTAVPRHMDGRVLQELFVLGKYPTVTYFDDSSYENLSQIEKFSDDDVSMVEDRLRKLGYLD